MSPAGSNPAPSAPYLWASLAFEAGVHPKVASERHGHSTVGITLDTSSHVVQGLDADAAAMVAKKLFSRRGPAEPRPL